MTSERELKLALDDRVALRERLRSEGALRLHAENFEHNTLWDRGEQLRSAGSLLRVRRDGQGTRLTFKGPASFEGGVKVRTEHETRVDNEASLEEILRALGYVPVRQYQKYREEWRLDGVVIALDRTPIGDFVEFEGDLASAVAQRCGCDPATALEQSYLALYDNHRASHPEASSEMVFAVPEAESG